MERSANQPPNESFLGFLSVLETTSHAFVGGLLILNRLGHPIEFHCTVPVHPNKAQEILYGQSLKPFLCGRQIASALYKRRKTEIMAILTDSPFVLPFQDSVDVPLILLLNALRPTIPNDETGKVTLNSLRPLPGIDWTSWNEDESGGLRLAISEKGRFDDVRDLFALFQKTIDPIEPFERIRLAVKESQRSA